LKFKDIFIFEKRLAEFTGAPFAVSTCCCTHALELCFRILNPSRVEFSCRTYMGVIMLLKNLHIQFRMINEPWQGEYNFRHSPIWDCARKLTPNMYVPGSYKCVSFGENKPLDLGRGGAILLDNEEHYKLLTILKFDGKDVKFDPWIEQKHFDVGYHYKMNNRECIVGLEKLNEFIAKGDFSYSHTPYRDCRRMIVKGMSPFL